MNLTLGEVRANLRQILEADHPLTAEQRYALMSSIELAEFVEQISPGLSEAVKQMKAKMNVR